ncbi:hypothetical protein ABZ479_35290 [Streptomyces sp. NPDC005722]
MGDGLSYEYREAEKMCFAGEVKTPFATGKNMDEMKAMLANANPDTVEGVAQAWGRVHDMLVKGDGSVRAVFDKAVDHVLQHWEGSAAEGFAAKAKKISTQIDNTATYAHYTSTAIQSAANVLRPVKADVDSMEKPSRLSSMGDALTDGFDRSEDWQKDIRENRGAQNALDNNEGSLSAGKEAQLQMAARMETLALTYSAQSKTMGEWRRRIDDPEDYPPAPIGQPPVPVVVPTTPSRTVDRPKTTTSRNSVTGSTGGTVKPSSNVKSPRDTGITGGVPKPATSTKPQVGTAIDGIATPPGTSTGIGGGTAGAGGGVGAGGAVGGGAGGAGGLAGGLPGGVAGAGLGARGGAGARGGSSGTGGRAGAAGRGGMPGAGGAGAGAGGRGGAAAGRGGSLARRGGGVVGAAKGTGSGTRGTPGGSGLHKSRGAAGAGGGSGTGRGANRMMGRGQTDRGEEEERREGERPDYLVEDEETWTPEQNNAPRVIE